MCLCVQTEVLVFLSKTLMETSIKLHVQTFVMIKNLFSLPGKTLMSKSFLHTLNAMTLFINKMLFKFSSPPCLPTQQLTGSSKSVQKEFFSSLIFTILQETAVNLLAIFNHVAKFQDQEKFFKKDGKLILQLIFLSLLEMKRETLFMPTCSELTLQPTSPQDTWL